MELTHKKAYDANNLYYFLEPLKILIQAPFYYNFILYGQMKPRGVTGRLSASKLSEILDSLSNF